MYKTHAVIDIDSKLRDRGDISQFVYILDNPIYFNRNRQYFTRIEKVMLPISFYNVFTNNGVSNGKLMITEDPAGTPDAITVTIPDGNYTADEMMTTLIALLNSATLNVNTYTMSFSDITGKITINTDTTEFRIDSQDSGSLINKMLGFTPTSSTFTSTSLTLTATSHTSFSTRRYVNLGSNLSSDNHYTKTDKKHIALQIPITQARQTLQYYDNHDGLMSKLDTFHNVSELRFSLTDADDIYVDLNGVDYTFQIVFYEFRIGS